MPALVAFNRKWRVGSDDFVLPCLISVIGRIIWLAAGLIMYAVHHGGLKCPGGVFLEVYAVGEAILLLITIIIEGYMGRVSAKGTITNVEPRRYFSKVLYIRVFVFGCEMIWNAVGTSWVFHEIASDETHVCEESVIHMIRSKVVASWVLLGFIMFCVLIFLVPRKKTGKKRVSSSLVWEKRCKMLCCCVADDKNARTAFADVAKLLASLFKMVDDVVMSDIAAGLVLVNAEQRSKVSTVTPPSVPGSVIADAAHFLPFASSAYGWPFFFLFGNPCCALCQLCGYFRICRRHDQDHHDNCCECNLAVVRKVTHLEASHIVYMNYRNNIFQIPFYVAIDEDSSSVVVAIRGSLSTEDFLTDAVAESARIDEVEGHELYAHKGILQAARDIKTILQKNKTLEKAFEKVPDFNLMIVGHSLGAGAAPLLSVLLHSTWPTLKCYAFEPPGGLINLEGVQFTSSFVISSVMGEDIVPRLSIETLYHLKEQVITAIGKSDKAKYQILLTCKPSGACCKGTADVAHSALVDSQPTETVGKTDSAEVEIEKSEKIQHEPSQRLYLPGKIMWVTERKSSSDSGLCCGGKELFQARWADYTEFNDILVSPSMVTEHICNELQKALDILTENTPRVLVESEADKDLH